MEQASQLRRLVQSPGWALLRTRWLRLVERSEAEKAQRLRSGKPEEFAASVQAQGRVDGITQAMREADVAIAEYEQSETPGY
jgi:hypothetical protein